MYTLDGFQNTKSDVITSSVKIGNLSISRAKSDSNPSLRARGGKLPDVKNILESDDKPPKQKREENETDETNETNETKKPKEKKEPKERKETREQRLQRLRREKRKKKSKKSKKEGFEDYNDLDSNNYALFDNAFETFKNGKTKTKTKEKDNSEPKKIKRLDKAQKGAKHKKFDKSKLGEYDEAFTNTNKPVYMLLPKAKDNSPIQILMPKQIY